MRKLINIFIAFGLMMPIFSLGVVSAESTTSTAPTSSSDSAQTTTTNDDSSKKTLEQRTAEYKANFKQTLTKAQQTAVKTKCKAAQGLTSSLSGRIKGIETSRAEVYKNVTDHLSSLQIKLQNKDVDTTELQAEIAALQTKISTYKTDLAAYKQSVADLSAMDCASDPAAFKSALEAARAARTKVVADTTDIRTYITGTIKPTLTKIHDSLAKSETTKSGQ